MMNMNLIRKIASSLLFVTTMVVGCTFMSCSSDDESEWWNGEYEFHVDPFFYDIKGSLEEQTGFLFYDDLLEKWCLRVNIDYQDEEMAYLFDSSYLVVNNLPETYQSKEWIDKRFKFSGDYLYLISREFIPGGPVPANVCLQLWHHYYELTLRFLEEADD